MVDNFRLTVDSNTEIEPLETVRDVRMKGQSLVDNRVATIPQMTGATSSSNGSAGVVPTPSVGDREKFLRGDGTWAEASGGGGSNVSVDQILDDGVNIMDITIDNVTTHIYAPEGGGTVTDVVDGDGTSLVDENGVAHVLGEVTDVVDKNNFSLVNNNVAKIPIEIDSTICSPIPDYANITDIEESKNWINTDTDYTWTAPCDCLLVPVVNNDTDFVEYTIDDFVLYSSWNNDSISTVNAFPIGYELIPLAKDTEISIRFLHRADGRFQVRYRYIPFKRLQTNQESYPQPYLDYRGIRTVSASDIQSGYTAFADGVFIGAYSNSNSRPVNCYINEETSKYYYMAVGNTPGSSMRLGEGDTIRLDSNNISGSGWFIPFATTDDPTEVYLPVPDYSNATSYTESDLSQDIPMGFLFNDNRHTTQATTSLLTTVLVLNTPTVVLNLNSISPVPTYEETRYNCVAWFPLSGEETFNAYYPASPSGEVMEGSFVNIPYSSQNVSVITHYNVDDVVDGDGASLVDANRIAHINAKVKDVLYDGVSMMDSDGVVELFPERKVTTLPLLDYENKTAISGSSSWKDTTIHKWTAPCDCVVYIYDQAGTNNTFVRYTIDDFVYYGTAIANNHSVPYGLCSNLLPVKKGQEITIQLLGQMMNNFYNKAFYIPYKLVNENDTDFPLPYLDHDNRVEIGYSVTSYTAPTDGMVVDYGNGVNTIVITVNGVETTFYGKGGSQYFDCSVPVSAGDVITLGSHSGKYFIPFKRTDNINKLVSPIPDYANRVAYSGDTLPTSFNKEGLLFLCAHNYDSYYSSVSADYIINSQSTLSVWAYKYAVSGTDYWKDSFAPVNRTMIKSSASTGNNINYYFIPYSEFESEFVKDVQVKGTSIVKAGGIANIDSMVTDVQNPKGESLVSEGGIATVSGKVFDVQLEGISILDENAVANLKSNMGTFVSPILDYDRIGFVEESKTWTDRNPHNWTAPCDCVVFSCSPNGYGCVFSIDGEFTYKAYKNALGNYNTSAYASYYSMLPVAEGSVVTFSQIGQKDTTASYKMAYIPYKKATTLQSTYTLPYLDYENKTAIEWASPIIANELICEYTAPVDGYVSIDLLIGSNTTPTVTYTVNNNSNVNVMTRAMETNYYPNGIILGKGDTVSIYDAGNVPTYTYTGNIYFTPFATTPSLREVVSPIPDYANLETLDLTDFPTTFDAGYIFNCAERQGDNLLKYCKITLSDSVKIYTKSAPYDVIHEYSYFPISGDETLVSVEYETNAGNVYYIPYSEVEVTPVLVSDVQVNGASVVDANGVAHITGGGGGSTVTVTPIQTTGTKIAEIDVDGVTSDLYAPNGGGGGSTVSVTQKVSSGENIASITVDGVATELYATNTTYSDFVGATSESAGTHGLVPAPTSEDRLKYLRANGTWGTPTNTTYSDFTGATSSEGGTHGLVPAPTTSDTTKFLKGDGTWGTVDSGSDVSVTQLQSTGTKIATVTIDGTDTDLYAPNGGGSGSSVSITPTVSSGTKIADYEIDGVSGSLYSPEHTEKILIYTLPNGAAWFSFQCNHPELGLVVEAINGDDIESWDVNPSELPSRTSGDNFETIGYVPNTQNEINMAIGSDTSTIYLSTRQSFDTSTISIKVYQNIASDVSELDELDDVEITSPTNGQILKYNNTTQKWENDSITFNTSDDLFGYISTLRVSDRYASASISNHSFNFNLNDYTDDWSTSATINNNTAIDITDYNSIEIDVTISEQADNGYLWITLSTTNYTWGGGEFPSIYKNVDSAIKISESGTYSVDVSELSGNYYIYIGGTSGKNSVTHASENNSLDGKIIGSVTEIRGVMEAAIPSVIPNPEGEPINTLNTIEIDGVVYDLPSGNIETTFEEIYQSPSDSAEQTITLSAPMTDFDLLILNISIGAFMQPIDTIEEETYLGGGNGSSYIWYSFDLSTPTILTRAYQGGGVWIRNIQGVKFGGGSSGNANMTELTQGEYNALTPVEKENGTMYLTHDGDEEVDLTVRMTGYTSTSGTASAVDSYNDSFLAWHAFASEDDFNSSVVGEYWCGKVNGYLQFDFDEVVNISKLSFASYGSDVTFDVMYSTDGTTYSLAERIVQNTPTSTPTRADIILTNTLENCVSIRLVCVSFTGANGGTIGAFHIYGNYGSITPNRIYLNGRKYAEEPTNVTLYGIDIPTSSQGDNGNFYFRIKSYPKVDYIETTGGIKDQCINTEIKFDENTTMDIDCEISSDVYGNYQALCGWRNTQPYYGLYTRVQAQNVFAVDYNTTSTAVIATDPGIYDERISVHCASDEWTWSNGTLSYSQTFDFNGETENMYLGSANFTGAAGNEQGKYKIYDFKVYKNNILENHFVPVLYNNHGAMVDVLTGKLYESVNTSYHFSYGQTTQGNVDIVISKYVKINGEWVSF